jgi:hypothetical protein
MMIVLSKHRGNFVNYLKGVMDWMGAWLTAASAVDAHGGLAPWLQPAAACGTGPP